MDALAVDLIKLPKAVCAATANERAAAYSSTRTTA